MKASDIMTTDVVTAPLDATRREIACLLLQHGISALPVVDRNGIPVGMVSEGDLIPRDEAERRERRDWWLKALAEGEEINPDFVRHLEAGPQSAGDIMIAPVVTVDESTDIVDIAELLASRRIKRVPVMREGRMVGIVSRADLVKAFAIRNHPGGAEPSSDGHDAEIAAALEHLDAMTKHRRPAVATSRVPESTNEGLSASSFQHLAERFREHEASHRSEARAQVAEAHHKQAQKMLAAKLTDASWQHMLRSARAAAQKGEEEQLLLRFPSELCTDHGRAVNAPDPEWPATLRGLPAEIFMRWKHELQPQGFRLAARVVEFPGGFPGDIGLFLEWGRSGTAK